MRYAFSPDLFKDMSNYFKSAGLIQSKDNPRIKQFCALSKAKKQRSTEGLFVLEGIRLIDDALKNGAEIVYILATQKALSELSSLDLLTNADVFEIPQHIAEKISQTQTPQGAFAVCKMPQCSLKLENCRRLLMLCDIQDNGNLGMIMRTADALKIDGLILCNCCDVFSPKTVRATMGSVFRVDFSLEKDANATLEKLKNMGFVTYAAVPRSDALSVAEHKFADKSVVLIGNEGNGLPQDVIDNCDNRITIRMNGTIESLNAAMAAGIMLWELCGKEVKSDD